MGVQINKPLSTLSEKAFHQLDYEVMALAFDLHNSIGNLWDENDYKTNLLELCIENGMDSHSEVQISVSHNEFTKAYFIDRLVEGAVYELKTALKIASSHESQTLNYLLLTNTRRAKIINFRPDSLEWRFTSTSLTQHQRTSYNLMTDNWERDGETCCDVPDLVSDLLNDRGAYLDIQLYMEAVLFFSGAPTDNNAKRFPPLSSERLLHVTGSSRKKSACQNNLQMYLNTSIHNQIDRINFGFFVDFSGNECRKSNEYNRNETLQLPLDGGLNRKKHWPVNTESLITTSPIGLNIRCFSYIRCKHSL